MNSLHTGIVTLLRSALNSEALTLPEDFRLEEASAIIYQHHLTGLALQGATLCGIPRSTPAVVQQTAVFCGLLQSSRLQTQKLRQILDLFDANEITYMTIKGAVIRELYPRPEYRHMTDADILIRPEQYPRIRQLLSSLGMEEQEDSDYEQTWSCPALMLELHRCLVSKHFLTYYDYYRDSWRFARKNRTGSGYHLSAEDHMVYFVVHFAKHYLAGSICAKDICDFYVWQKAHPDMDDTYIRKELEKLHLGHFYRNVLDLLANWFQGAPSTEATELITRAAFQGGVNQDFNHSAAKNIMHRRGKENDRLGAKKVKWFLRAIFPSAAVLSCTYPVLRKAPVLLPVFWVRRWFAALVCDRDMLRRGIIVAGMDKNSLSEYDSHMAQVGLGGIDQG